MKPSNPIYPGGPLADKPDESTKTQCSNCKLFTDAKVWLARRGYCPKCGAWGAYIQNED